MAVLSTPKKHLFDLPRELLDEIYEYVAVLSRDIETGKPRLLRIRSYPMALKLTIEKRIRDTLLVCKEFHEHIKAIFLGANVFQTEQVFESGYYGLKHRDTTQSSHRARGLNLQAVHFCPRATFNQRFGKVYRGCFSVLLPAPSHLPILKRMVIDMELPQTLVVGERGENTAEAMGKTDRQWTHFIRNLAAFGFGELNSLTVNFTKFRSESKPDNTSSKVFPREPEIAKQFIRDELHPLRDEGVKSLEVLFPEGKLWVLVS